MKRPTFYIQESKAQFLLKMQDENELLLLSSKTFNTALECEKFVDILRVHMRFQTNFSRSKNRAGQYGFEVRTCWDDLIAKSAWFNTRQDREAAMQAAYDANTHAVFLHTDMHKMIPSVGSSLQEVA
ncbi:MAG: hypothetical protein QMC70_11375 [Bacteroidia bacterium]|jgi:hypothetical protein|tara:strand:+ start:5625 stop:6005 length:381 start_codon:yes stop_codon:yes gene_type:complete